jgi:hypothetical protein
MGWLFENRAFLEEHHAGKWVAIEDGGLKGIGSTASEAREAAADVGAHNPLLTGVRSKEYQNVLIVPGFRVIRSSKSEPDP